MSVIDSLKAGVQKLTPAPADPVVNHPFDIYRDPDFEVASDRVEVREIDADRADRLSGRAPTDAQRAGFRAAVDVHRQRTAERAAALAEIEGQA